MTMASDCERCAGPASWLVSDAGNLVCVKCASRARAIRAVVAAQWAVMIALITDDDDGPTAHVDLGDPYLLRGVYQCIHDVAALPTPEQIVDGDA